MTKILIISYLFPPLNSTGCRRVYAWAKYLKKIGHEVTVLTADTPDEEKTKNFNVDCSTFQIYRVKYFDPRGLIKKIFKIKGPLSDGFGTSSKKRLTVLLVEKVLKMLNMWLSSRGAFLRGVRLPTFSDLWFLAAYKKAKIIIREQDIKVIITSFPPPVVNLVAIALRKKFKEICWIQDIRDLWTQNPTHKGLFPFTIMEGFLERMCINNSDVIIVVSGILKQWLEEKYPLKKKDIFSIENGYDEELLGELNSGSSPSNKLKKTILYAGTLYAKRSNPEGLFKVVDKNCDYLKDKLEIAFYGSYETKVILDKFFDKYSGTKEIIKYKGFISGKDIIEEENKADALLFIERDKENDGTLTAKIFEYMLFRKPILCIGIVPSTYIGSILKETGLCIFCGDDMMKIEESLDLIIKGGVKISPNQDFISNFSREKQVERLNELIKCYSSY